MLANIEIFDFWLERSVLQRNILELLQITDDSCVTLTFHTVSLGSMGT